MRTQSFLKTISTVFLLAILPAIILAIAPTSASANPALLQALLASASGPATLTIPTTSQTVLAGACSAVVTVSTGGNVPSNLTVNLSGPAGVTFYSDNTCAQAITTVTVTTGTNSANFYFIANTTGSKTLTTTATAYVAGTQGETISTNNFVWTGGGGNANWSTGTNWAGNNAPGGSDVAVFDSTCSSNCSPTIDAPISIAGIRLNTGYGGTITQGTNGITLNWNGFAQLAGTFNGGSANIVMNHGSFALSGGSFRSTSGTFSTESTYNDQTSRYWTVTGSPTFNANGGIIKFNSGGHTSGDYTYITPGSVTYANVTFAGWYQAWVGLQSGTMHLSGDLTLNSTYGGPGSGSLENGTVEVQGNVNLGNWEGGSALVKLMGNASGQTIAGSSSNSNLPNLEIATGANPVTFTSVVGVYGDFTVTSVGTFTSTGSTLRLNAYRYTTRTITPGSVAYNNVTFVGNYTNSYTISGTVNIAGNLVFTTGDYAATAINTGTLSVAGNVTSDLTLGGNSPITFVGTTTQTLNVSTLSGGTLTLNQTGSGKLSLGANFAAYSTGQALTVTAGVLDLNGYNLTGSFALTNSATIKAKGSETATLQSLTSNSGSTVIYYGTGTYTTTPGVLSLGSTYYNLTFDGVGGSWKYASSTTVSNNMTITNGTVVAAANISIGNNWSNAGTFTAGTNTVTFASSASHTLTGATTFYNLTMDNSGNAANNTLTFPASTTQAVSGTLTLKGNATNKLSLRSSSNGTQWSINPSGTRTISKVDVKDSNNTNAVLIDASNSCTNSGNNTKWGFTWTTLILTATNASYGLPGDFTDTNIFEMIGGGGGGGGGTAGTGGSARGGGGGGGGGAYGLASNWSIPASSTISVTIGTAGGAGAAGGSGTAGGTTSVVYSGFTRNATGGAFGAAATGGGTQGNGAASTTNCPTNFAGGNGAAGSAKSGSNGGVGGGGGGAGGTTAAGSAGSVAVGGAGGTASGGSAGNGSVGGAGTVWTTAGAGGGGAGGTGGAGAGGNGFAGGNYGAGGGGGGGGGLSSGGGTGAVGTTGVVVITYLH